eukprot:TRINITY_DN84731_c0_g1_i1.p1 TRINITY_DN84731_c0_g1~~TRINITY_DN84731_c0_g1_i1.p1  ORF type:complete len:629 (-),score=100.41 TRINITY_DN84731_c0_g1_i1:44-1930(-)
MRLVAVAWLLHGFAAGADSSIAEDVAWCESGFGGCERLAIEAEAAATRLFQKKAENTRTSGLAASDVSAQVNRSSTPSTDGAHSANWSMLDSQPKNLTLAQSASKLVALAEEDTAKNRTQASLTERQPAQEEHLQIASNPPQAILLPAFAPHGQRVGSDDKEKGMMGRMSDSFKTMILGFSLFLVSVPILWVGERRTAQMASVISLAEREYKTVDADNADPANRGELVHITGGVMHAAEEVVDPVFEELRSPSGVVKIRSVVEIYQWVCHEEKTEGKSEDKKYTYTAEWNENPIFSGSFPPEHQNVNPVQNLQYGERTVECRSVEYGEGFMLSEVLVQQLALFKDATHKGNLLGLGDYLTFETIALVQGQPMGTIYTFAKEGDHFYFRQQPDQLSIGDTRVRVEYMPDGPATILALQAEGKHESRDEFWPYRLVPRPWWQNLGDERRRELLLKEATKDVDDIVKQTDCNLGLFNCVCCCFLLACHLANCVMMHTAMPEIHHAWSGSKSAADCLADLGFRNSAMKWTCRIIAWGTMVIGLYLVFSPVLVGVNLVPFFGKWLSHSLSFIIAFLCVIATLIISCLLVAAAYFVYYPRTALIYVALACASTAGVLYMCSHFRELPASSGEYW